MAQGLTTVRCPRTRGGVGFSHIRPIGRGPWATATVEATWLLSNAIWVSNERLVDFMCYRLRSRLGESRWVRLIFSTTGDSFVMPRLWQSVGSFAGGGLRWLAFSVASSPEAPFSEPRKGVDLDGALATRPFGLTVPCRVLQRRVDYEGILHSAGNRGSPTTGMSSGSMVLVSVEACLGHPKVMRPADDTS